VLVKLEATQPEHAFAIYTFWWRAGEHDLASCSVGDEDTFARCVAAAVDSGFTPSAASGGWGPPERSPNGSFRACRPSLGPGGAAYLAVPVPSAPLPRATQLRLHYDAERLEGPASVSILANGRFREVGRLQKDKNPAHLELDASFIFAEEGTKAPGMPEETSDVGTGEQP
jgi:hypothetical protein